MTKSLLVLCLTLVLAFTFCATAQAWQVLYSQDTGVGKSLDVKCDNGTTFRIFQNTYLYKDKRFRYESGSGNVPYKCGRPTPHWQPGSVASQICQCLGSR